MSRLYFFEAIVREVDFQVEYVKLEKMCAEEYGRSMYNNGISINSWITRNFRLWKKRSNYTSFDELRKQLGFSINKIEGEYYINKKDIRNIGTVYQCGTV